MTARFAASAPLLNCSDKSAAWWRACDRRSNVVCRTQPASPIAAMANSAIERRNISLTETMVP